MAQRDETDQLTGQETAKRMAAALRRALNTPPQHKPTRKSGDMILILTPLERRWRVTQQPAATIRAKHAIARR